MENDKKVKDVLKDLPIRKVLGHKVIRSVGRRAWERPKVAISSRLYQIYAIPDPFMPTEAARKWLIGLGPVSLKLGENRRQPAPHLRPKEPKKKRTGPTRPKLPNVPRAKIRSEESKPRPKIPVPQQGKKGKPVDKALQEALEKQKSQGIQRRTTRKKDRSDLAAEFGAGTQKHKLARLPVRPDLVSKEEQSNKTPSNPVPQQRSVPIQRSIPRPSQNNSKRNGRIRMKRSVSKPTVTRTPIVTPKNEPTKKATESPQKVVRTARPKAPNSMSLDDLFGVPSGDNKPIRLRSNRKKTKK